MKVWLDALTPKQLLLAEYIMRRGADHTFLFTARTYRELDELAQIRGLCPIYVGRFGGGSITGKLDASVERLAALSGMVQEFGPDVTVSFQSPEAARISYGLGIPHIAFCNTPHAEAACRLTIPLCTRILVPQAIPKTSFVRYGIDASHIISYNALDEAAIIQNPPAQTTRDIMFDDRPIILFRAYEAQASYKGRNVDQDAIIDALVRNFPQYNIVISGRYAGQISSFRSRHPNCTVLDGAVDGGTLLGMCEVFVGSGGTMTTEAALRGVPTISYRIVWSSIESYLESNGLLHVAQTPQEIVQDTRRLIGTDRSALQEKSQRIIQDMEDIYDKLYSQLQAVA